MAKDKNIKDLPLGTYNVSKLKYINSYDGQYGTKHLYSGEVNGEKLVMYCKDKHKDILDSGAGIAETFMLNGNKCVKYDPAGNITGQPQNQQHYSQPQEDMREVPLDQYDDIPAPQKGDNKPDWDAIALGKCRTLFAVEAYKMGKHLTADTEKEIEAWANFAVGKHKEKPDLPF